MYKPPQNGNRVKSIKSKFENIDNKKEEDGSPKKQSAKTSPPRKNNFVEESSIKNTQFLRPDRETQNGHQSLLRQLSDPSKRNIKRTPAFRMDKNVDRSHLQKKDSNQFESKVKQFNSVKSCENKKPKDISDLLSQCAAGILYATNANNIKRANCDLSEIALKQNNSFLHSDVSNNAKTTLDSKPVLIKSKSSHDFQYIRNKFNNETVLPVISSNNVKSNFPSTSPTSKSDRIVYGKCNKNEKCQSEALILKNVDLSLLYTEPIPKSLRNKNSSESSGSNTESPLFRPKIDNIYTKSTLQLTENDKKEFLESLKKVLKQDASPENLTDSLRVALKKPLPHGPAPQKPPRTFQHSAESSIANTPTKSQASKETRNGLRKNGKKSDPKYMLNKLEMALKNNKLKSRQKQKMEVSTSGEDSDDSLLYRSKTCKNLPKPTIPNGKSAWNLNSNGFDSIFSDLNCFNSLSCTNRTYERIPDPNSTFFVGKVPDPIYAEPIHNKLTQNGEVKKNRNSLYYMSTSLIPEDTGQTCLLNGSEPLSTYDMEEKRFELKEETSLLLNRQISAENSSLSSFTSDLDSNPSPVTDDPHLKIKYLIENFEHKRQTLPNIDRSDRNTKLESTNNNINSPSEGGRVELLRNSIRKTLDKSFNSEIGLASSKDSDSEKNEEGKVARMVARFRTFQKTAPKYQQPNINTDTLFYCCLVIEKVHDCAQIKFKFPPKVDVPKNIEHLCFPESSDSPPLEGSSSAQTYSLLITNETGDRTYGYCRRVLPEGSTYCLPLAYCILSKYRAPRFYKKILLELESRHGMQNKFRDELISQFYFKKFPKPGESITINLSQIEDQKASSSHNSKGLEESLELTTSFVYVNKTGAYESLSNNRKTAIFVSENDIAENSPTPSYVTYEGNKTELVLTLHPDTRYEDADLKRLHKLPSDILLKIFSSLLLERKVVLISSVISELSSCVDSLQSILYPFTWYHTFIPILPESLWDIVESPTPVVCGVLSESAIKDRHIENGIVVNLDTQTTLVEEGDEMKILSGSLHKVWRQFITLANNTKSMEYVYSVYLADAYLYVFICCFKNYKQYVVNGHFLKDELVKNAKTKGIRRFLKMFTETCMFHAFMDAALNNPESLALFDKKIELYGSDESRVILDKLMEWHP